MKIINSLEFYIGSKEEKLPNFNKNFPYIASCVELNGYIGNFAPWHWHKAIELFYLESGKLEYCTPKGNMIFTSGSGGMVNSNVLHMTKILSRNEKDKQLIHIFDPSLIAGEHGSQIEQNYITPIIATPQLEMIALYPDNPTQANILNLIYKSFHLSEDIFGYEIKLREALSEIWLYLFEFSYTILQEKAYKYDKTSDKIKLMMVYIHEHYADKISVPELASSAFLSERECFRVFQNCLHMTPVEYIKGYRLQMACRMLSNGRESITYISQACGLGSSSYFGKVFRECIGCTPLEYRRRWQNNNI